MTLPDAGQSQEGGKPCSSKLIALQVATEIACEAIAINSRA